MTLVYVLTHSPILRRKRRGIQPKEIYIRKFLSYTDAKVSEEKQEQLTRLIINNLPKEDGEELMRTIADSYKDEGVNKGIAIGEARGVEKTARRMLQENTDINFIVPLVVKTSIFQMEKL